MKVFQSSIYALIFLIMVSVSHGLEIGSEIPSKNTFNEEGQVIDLAQQTEADWVLVYFYPKADTPGCTKQGCSLRDHNRELALKGVKIFGASGDLPQELKKFKDKYKFPFTLLSDPEGKLMDAFGVDRKGSIASREAYLFKKGKLVWKDKTASTSDQAKDVLEAIEKSKPESH